MQWHKAAVIKTGRRASGQAFRRRPAERDEKIEELEISSNVKEISGIINLDDGFDLKKESGFHILEKYLRCAEY